MTANYPPSTTFKFNGRLTIISSVPTAPPLYTIQGLFNSDGSFGPNGIAFLSNDVSLGAQTNLFITDILGNRYQITNVNSNGALMNLTTNDIDNHGAGPNTGNGTIYLASTLSNISLTGTVTSSGLSQALQQGIRNRALNELDQILGGSGVKTVSVVGVAPTTVLTLPTVTGTTYFVEINIAGRDTVGPTSYGGKNTATYQNNAGVLVRVPLLSVDDKLIFRDAVGWTVDTAISGTNIVVNVVGSVGTVNWNVKWNVTSVQ